MLGQSQVKIESDLMVNGGGRKSVQIVHDERELDSPESTNFMTDFQS